MSAWNVLIVGEIHASGLDLLAERRDLVFTQIGEDADMVAAHMIAADAVIVRAAKLDATIIGSASRLRLVARFGIGYDNVDVAALTARGIPLAIVGDENAGTVAEHALLLIMMLAKRALQWNGVLRDGAWRGDGLPFGADLSGKSVLIVGLGRTGARVARMCRALDMMVLAYDPYIDDAAFAAVGAARVQSLAHGLAAADFTSLHVPLNGETRMMIGAPQLKAMPPHAYLINVSRGGLIDETALTRALKKREIAGAGIDVFELEPIGAASPLARFDDMVLTPHVAGISVESLERMSVRCAQNIIDFIDGTLDPAYVVNPQVLSA